MPRCVMILKLYTCVNVFACLIHFQGLQVKSNLDFCCSWIDHYTYFWKREKLDFYHLPFQLFLVLRKSTRKMKRIMYLGDTVEAIDEVSLRRSIFKSGGFFDFKAAFIFPSFISPSPRSWADSRRNWGLLGLWTNGGELTEDSLLDLKIKRMRHRDMKNVSRSAAQIGLNKVLLIKNEGILLFYMWHSRYFDKKRPFSFVTHCTEYIRKTCLLWEGPRWGRTTP